MSQLLIGTSPTYNDLSDSVLLANNPLTQDAIGKVANNIKMGVVRPETIFMGFYKNGDTVPAPISPVDGYVYTVSTEVTWHLIFYSTRAAGIGFQSGQSTAPPIAASQGGVQYWWTADINSSGVVATSVGYINNGGTEVDGNDGMVKIYAVCQRTGPTVQAWTNLSTASGGATTVTDASAGGFFASWMVGFDLNIASGTNFTPGQYLILSFIDANNVTVASTPTASASGSGGHAKLGIPAFLDIPDGVFAVQQPLKQGFAANHFGILDLSHNGKAGNVRCEVIPMGFYASGATIPLPVSPIDGYPYGRGEIQYRYTFYTSLQPTGSFTNGQTTAPTLGSGLAKRASKTYGFLYWHRHDIDQTTGILSTNVSYFVPGGAETITTDGVVKVMAICQRQSINAAIVGLSEGEGIPGLANPGAKSSVPEAPILGAIRGLSSESVDTYVIDIGILQPTTAVNWVGIVGCELQIASDSGFTNLNGGAIYDNTGLVIDDGGVGVTYADNVGGTYYLRARVANSFGFGPWTTIGYNTHLYDNLAQDTGLMAATVAVLTVSAGASNVQVPANALQIQFYIPIQRNFTTLFGWQVFIHNSSTLPKATVAMSGTGGQITRGVASLTDSGASFPTVSGQVGADFSVAGTAPAGTGSVTNQSQSSTSGTGSLSKWNVSWTGGVFTVTMVNPGENYAVSDTITINGTVFGGTHPTNDLVITVNTSLGGIPNNYDIVVFSNGRGGSPTFDYEGYIILAEVLSATSTVLTFDAGGQNLHLTQTGLTWYLVQRNAGCHFFEKLLFTSPITVDIAAVTQGPLTQVSDVELDFPDIFNGQMYVWVSLYNLFGAGPVASGPSSAQFSGIVGATVGLNTTPRGLVAIIDGGGATIATGIRGELYVPFDCTISAAVLLADQVGSAVLDIWRIPIASYPPTIANTIVASDPPTISSAQFSIDTALTGWETQLNKGDTLIYKVVSCTSIQRLNVTLPVVTQ